MVANVARSVVRVGRSILPHAEPKLIPEHGVLIKDPAIERWNYVRENTTPFFKWTGKTVSMALFWCIGIPGACLYVFKRDLELESERAGKPMPKIFPFTLDADDRKTDPLPPRKPGVNITYKLM